MKVLLAILLMLAFPAGSITKLPNGKVGQGYSASIGSGLNACIENTEARTNPGMYHGLPLGTALSSVGVVSGTPTKAGAYQFVAVCQDKRVLAEVRIEK